MTYRVQSAIFFLSVSLDKPEVAWRIVGSILLHKMERYHHRESSPLSKEIERAFLDERIQRTWESIQSFQNPVTQLPNDRIALSETERTSFPRTKPTNIGLDFTCFLAAEKAGLLTPVETEANIRRNLQALKKLERSHGFFYDWYDTNTSQVLTHWPDGGAAMQPFLSSVDNAWLALTLLITQQAQPQLAADIQEILGEMDFEFFFDTDKQKTRGGYSPALERFSDFCYARHLLSEPRIIPWVQAAMTNEEPQRSEILKRLLDENGQIPQQLSGGALFELLMPRLFIREEALDPVVEKIFEEHRKFGGTKLGGFTGLSVTDDPNEGRYREMGVGGSYPASTVLASHGLALGLLVDPLYALWGLSEIERLSPDFYGTYGYRDAVDVQTGATTNTQVYLDQAMVFLSLTTYQNSFLQKLFDQYFTSDAPAQLSNV